MFKVQRIFRKLFSERFGSPDQCPVNWKLTHTFN